MEVKVIGSGLYQWELGRQIKITPPAGASVNRVEFSQALNAEALAVAPHDEKDVIVADIPNILLQNGEPIFVYLVYCGEDCLETTASYVLPVIKRPKPADYVYTETEVMTYAALDERITELEKGGNAVKTVNGVSPDENGNVEIEVGSGGAVSWNDLTDKPFGDFTVEQTLVASQVLNVPTGQSGTTRWWTVSVQGFVPTVGVTYTIEAIDTMTGAKLRTTAIAEIDTSTYFTIYKIGKNTDDIYLLGSIVSIAVYVNGTGYMGWRVDIYEEVETYTTLDEKYLPESVVLESELEAKGYQTAEQITTLINNALGVIENGTY